jgi:hypothetical protein
MILIETIYKRVEEDLSNKGTGGYSSSDEFNRSIADAQNILLDYYVRHYEESGVITDSVRVFIKRDNLSLTNYVAPLPGDYRRWVDGVFIELYNDDECDEPTKKEILMYYCHGNGFNLTEANAIRKTGEKRVNYTIEGANLRAGRKTGRVLFSYIRKPNAAVRGYTTNEETRNEDYDAATTTDLEWPDSEANMIIAIMLYFKGIEIRDLKLQQFVVGLKQFEVLAGQKVR